MKIIVRAVLASLAFLAVPLSIVQAESPPDFLWVRTGGGGSLDQASGLATDAAGNVYVTGYFFRSFSVGETNLPGYGDVNSIFIAKYNGAGQLVWAQQAGGAGASTQGYGIAVDNAGNVFVTGKFTGTVSFSSTVLVSTGSSDLFLAKYNAQGTLLWVQQGGGTSNDIGNAVAIDAAGNAYVTGSFIGPATFGGVNLTGSGNSDVVVAKYNGDGIVVWAKEAGGTNIDNGYGVALDSAGNILLTGRFVGTATFGTDNPISAGGSDAFLAKLDAAGNFLWTKAAGGTGSDTGRDVSADSDGNILITGSFYGSANFESTNLTAAGLVDAYVAKYDAGGGLLWVRQAGGVDSDSGSSVKTDAAGNVFVSGYFSLTGSFGTTNLASAGGYDVFVAKYDSLGNTVWAVGGGGADYESATGMAIVGNGDIFLMGYFYYPSSTFGVHTVSAVGNYDVFLAKLIPPGPPQIVGFSSSPTVLPGANVTFSVTAIGQIPLYYQWLKNGVPIPGATSSSFQIANAQFSDDGSYTVGVTNSQGSVLSQAAVLTVGILPAITLHPIGTNVLSGTSVTLSAAATGKPAPTYQWRKSTPLAPLGIDIPGATNVTLVLSNVQVGDDANYTCVARNELGAAVTSAAAVLVNFIDVPSVADMVYDHRRDVLYISSGNEVLRFHLPSNQFLSPLLLSGMLSGIDLSPDGNTLVVADRTHDTSQAWVHVVDLANNGAARKAIFTRGGAYSEGGTYAVAFGNDEAVLVTSLDAGSGAVPLRRYEPRTDQVSIIASVQPESRLSASGDRKYIALVEALIASSPVYRYSVADRIFVGNARVPYGDYAYQVGANRDGSQIAAPNYGSTPIYGSTMNMLTNIGGWGPSGPRSFMGIAYHPKVDLAYLSQQFTSEVLVFETASYSEVDLLDFKRQFGGAAFGYGQLRISEDGRLLFGIVEGGVRFWMLDLPPVIMEQPLSQIAAVGTAVSLRVVVNANPAPTYQWYKAGAALSYATNATLGFPSLSVADAGNYWVVVSNSKGTVTSDVATLMVVEAPTITWPAPSPITYSTALSAAQLNASSPVAGSFAYSPAAGTVLNAGLGQVLTAVFTPDDTNSYAVVTNTVTLDVLKAPLMVTADNQSRQYGVANPALTFAYSGFVNGETAAVLDSSPAATTTATPASNAGNYPITFTGGSDNNYAFTFVNDALTITKAPLIATADSKSRPYGAANPLTITYSGFLNGDTAAVIDTPPTAATPAIPASSLGTYPITLSGGSDNNYALTLVNGTLTVTKTLLTVTAENKSRTYGAANPPLTLTYTGFANGENASVLDTPPTVATSATPASDAGNYPITVTGGGDDHYDLVFNNGTLTVTKALLTVRAENKSRPYGSPNPELTIAYNGFVNGETTNVLDVLPTAATTATSGSNAGNYLITLTIGNDNNYAFITINGTLTVGKASLTVQANDASRAYGAANPSLGATITGFVNGNSVSVISGAPAFTLNANGASAVGTYAIVPSLGTLTAANYVFGAFAAGTLTVTPAALTISADNKTRAYGAANPAFTGSLAGVLNGDALSLAFVTSATVSSAVGLYPITPLITDPGTKLGNYTVSTNLGALTVTTASLTVAGNNASRVYGDANPPLSGSLSGLVAGDSITAAFTSPATAASAVGGHPILPSLEDAGGRLGNYAVTTNAGTLTITKAALVITPDNASRPYGQPNPVFTGTISGLKNNDVITASYTTTATPTSAAGTTHPITASPVDPNGRLSNYTVTLNSGTLTITRDDPPILTLVAEDVNYVEKSPPTVLDPTATVTDGGSLNFDGGVLNVSIVANGRAEDRLGIHDEGYGTGKLKLVNNSLAYSFVVVGNFSGGTGTEPLVISLNPSSTPTAAQAILRNLTYSNASANPSTGPRTVRMVLSDGDGGNSLPAVKQIQIIPVNDPPTVAISSPANSAKLKAGWNQLITAQTADVDGTVARVEFFEGANKLGESVSPPFNVVWTNVSLGSYTLKAIATDDQGASTNSATVLVTVNPAIQQPRFVPAQQRASQFEMGFIGVPGTRYNVEISTNLLQWGILTNILAAPGTVPVIDPTALGIGQRFYRMTPAP